MEGFVSEEDIIRAGITAVKSGDLTRAASLFAQVVKANPASERGWFLLGMSCSTLEQREYCLRRVLAINPNHSEARKQLASLPRPVSMPPLARVSQNPPPVITPKPPAPAATLNSPFIYDDTQGGMEKAAPIVFPDEIPVQKPDKPEKGKPQKKKLNIVLLVSIFSFLILIVCGLGVAYLLVSTQMTQLTSPGAPVPVLLSTVTTTSTPVVVFTATPTSTLIPPTVLPSPLPTVVYQPRFEDAQCKFDIPRGADVKCGYVVVPEDRTGDPSDTIRLAVAVFHGKSKNPALEPVMFLQGGPGAEAVQLSADAYNFLVAPFLSKRDFITFDQRGTGLSEPVLNCDELKKAYAQDIHGLIPATTRNLVYSNAFLSCNGLMSAQGVNLNAFTTIESAADVKDVLSVLA
jgi:hypothetical protein